MQSKKSERDVDVSKEFKGRCDGEELKKNILQLEIKGRITVDMMELVEGLKDAMFYRKILCAAVHAERKDDTISFYTD